MNLLRILVFFCVSLFPISTFANTNVRICNGSGKDVFVTIVQSYAENFESYWKEGGWRKVESGNCETVVRIGPFKWAALAFATGSTDIFWPFVYRPSRTFNRTNQVPPTFSSVCVTEDFRAFGRQQLHESQIGNSCFNDEGTVIPISLKLYSLGGGSPDSVTINIDAIPARANTTKIVRPLSGGENMLVISRNEKSFPGVPTLLELGTSEIVLTSGGTIFGWEEIFDVYMDYNRQSDYVQRKRFSPIAFTDDQGTRYGAHYRAAFTSSNRIADLTFEVHELECESRNRWVSLNAFWQGSGGLYRRVSGQFFDSLKGFSLFRQEGFAWGGSFDAICYGKLDELHSFRGLPTSGYRSQNYRASAGYKFMRNAFKNGVEEYGHRLMQKAISVLWEEGIIPEITRKGWTPERQAERLISLGFLTRDGSVHICKPSTDIRNVQVFCN